MIFDLIVIGGGAAGFFGAIQAKTKNPGLTVLILEKSSKLLSKVRVSGGGRCNVTHHSFNPFELSRHYPRGERQLKKVFQKYGPQQVKDWFMTKGVQLKAENDGRMFPITDNSETIIDCFINEAQRLGLNIKINGAVTSLSLIQDIFEVEAGNASYRARKVLVAIGGNAKPDAYEFLLQLGHNIVSPMPSLFTFNDSEDRFKDLMGVSVPRGEVRIATTKFSQRGPVLITHWGLSGPAIIRLSAWAAEYLYHKQYTFDALINWIGIAEDVCRAELIQCRQRRGKQKVIKNPVFELPQRLWQRLSELAEIGEDCTFGDTSMRQINRLIENLTHCVFRIKGKTTFKEEFVTCGGIDLSEVDFETMESRKIKNLFFAGEVLNIDGETGGFNFQAAWTTAFVAAQSIS